MSRIQLVELITQAGAQGAETKALCRRLNRTPQDLGYDFEFLRENGQIIGFAGTWIAPKFLDELKERIKTALSELHASAPQEPLFSPTEISRAARMRWEEKPMARLLAKLSEDSEIRARNGRFGLADQAVEPKPATRQLLDRVRAELDRHELGAMTPVDLARALQIPPQAVDSVLESGANLGELSEPAPGFWLTREREAQIERQLQEAFKEEEPTVAQVRDLLDTSRRIAHALLEQRAKRN